MKAKSSDAADELEAMKAIAGSLTGLDQEAVSRVLRWASERFLGRKTEVTPPLPPPKFGAADGAEFKHLADLFAAARPKTDARKALVVGYWHQYVMGEQDFDTQTINNELKDLGYGILNITRAFDALKQSVPALAAQIKKGGTTKQARKRMKITDQGKRTVEQMLKKPEEQEEAE